MKFNFDAKILSVQIPSGILFGILAILLSRFVHLPLVPTSIQFLICLILVVDVLHTLGKINIDISNLFKREKFARKLDHEHPVKILQIYLEEHLIFLLALFFTLIVTRIVFHFFHK